MKTVGIDGCRFGWVSASYDDEKILLFETLKELVNHYGNGCQFLIDMPIGLASERLKDRNCEVEVRTILPIHRKSSVFSVPCREAISEKDYVKANEINKAILGKGLSKQTFHIMPKIKELDTLLYENPKMKQLFKESHPEVAFQFLNNEILQHKKKSVEGITERLDILMNNNILSKKMYENALSTYLRKDVARDDILDALCLALTLHLTTTLSEEYSLHCFPVFVKKDEYGIEMGIYYSHKQKMQEKD